MKGSITEVTDQTVFSVCACSLASAAKLSLKCLQGGQCACVCETAVKANNITHLTQKLLWLSFWYFSSRKKKVV